MTLILVGHFKDFKFSSGYFILCWFVKISSAYSGIGLKFLLQLPKSFERDTLSLVLIHLLKRNLSFLFLHQLLKLGVIFLVEPPLEQLMQSHLHPVNNNQRKHWLLCLLKVQKSSQLLWCRRKLQS